MKDNVVVKVIANYLPQYHRIPENDAWWGEGYTDWVAAKNAKPLFEGHQQPRVPLNDNYYDLSDVNVIRWQAELAQKYGVYGFGIYHYWFNSNLQLLQKPSELLLMNKDIDINFMFLWDNLSWKRSWSKFKGGAVWTEKYEPEMKNNQGEHKCLAELDYGVEKDWKKHFEYLLPFFLDKRYIRINNKPIFGFMQPQNNPNVVGKIASYWDGLAKSNGLDGIMCLGRGCFSNALQDKFCYSLDEYCNNLERIYNILRNKLMTKFDMIRFRNYDKSWEKNLKKSRELPSNCLLTGRVGFDDTPRRGEKGSVTVGSTPAKFQKYMTELLKISKEQGKEYVFCPAWNEWGEGMYLEPDTINGYGYLEALKAAVDEVNGED